jgi:methyl coenzyme M reductase gamma subunit
LQARVFQPSNGELIQMTDNGVMLDRFNRQVTTDKEGSVSMQRVEGAPDTEPQQKMLN